MDIVDKKILRILTKDPTTAFTKIGNELGISSNSVQKRYDRLIENKIVNKASVILDLSKVGFEGKGFLFISNAKDYDSKQTVNYLKKIANLFFIAQIVGIFDILVMIAFKNTDDLNNLIREIRSQPSVERVEIAITNETSFIFSEEYTKMPLL